VSPERERQAAENHQSAAGNDQVLRCSVSIRVGEIIQALQKKARTGDAHAARELRSWLAEYPPQDEDIDFADLDKVTRQRMLRIVMAKIEEEDAAAETRTETRSLGGSESDHS
jgi:hypothetical protein